MLFAQLRIHLIIFWICIFTVPIIGYSQEQNDTVFLVKDLTSFESPGKEWDNIGDVTINPDISTDFRKTTGSGIILANVVKAEAILTTRKNFGDIELEFDFLLSKGTKPAILLQGRYRLNLSDSWAETNPSYKSMGGVGKRIEHDFAAFSGAAPFVNVAKAPGLWQHVRLRFRAPQFVNNIKTSNAVLEEVYINDCLVQQNLELQGASEGSVNSGEQAEAPVVFYSGNGVFAFKNFQARKPRPFAAPRVTGRRPPRVTNPITIKAEVDNYFLRGFLNYKNKKRTHVISVGSPREINYSYDLKQGALLQVWNGPFLDVTEMWEQRGEPQLAKPLGSVVILSEAPALAVLPDVNAVWPDSTSFDEFKNLGYTLDTARNPAFEYETAGYHVRDKIAIANEGRSLTRQFYVTNMPSNLYCRLAASSAIIPLGKGLYVVGDKTYFIRIDEGLKPFLRNTSAGVELLVAVTAARPVSYSLIW